MLLMAATKRHNNKTTYNNQLLWGEVKVRELLYNKFSSTLELSIKDLIKLLLIMLIVIAIGLFITNQFLEMTYKFQLIADPCTVCRNLNNNIIINWSNISFTP